jgi:hypothetical protein
MQVAAGHKRKLQARFWELAAGISPTLKNLVKKITIKLASFFRRR